MPSVTAKGQRSPTIMMHLAKEPSDEALRAIIQECGTDKVDYRGQPLPQGADEALFERAKAQWPSLKFYSRERFVDAGNVELSLLLYAPPQRQISTGRRIELPEGMRGSREWASFSANPWYVRHAEATDMTWFLSKARPALELLAPDFAFADADATLYKNLDPNPWERAWPLMVFSPDRVRKIGRDTLLDAPAWKVEELPYGGVWVQVWENPFDAPQEQVSTLAKYLGLEARER